MIYAIAATEEGKRAIARYEEGEQEGLPLMYACVLATAVAQDKPVTVVELIRVLSTEFPFGVQDGGISNAIEKLAREGFVTIIREITSETRITVKIDVFTIPTTVGAFLAHNPSIAAQERRMFDELKWHGVYTAPNDANTPQGRTTYFAIVRLR